MTEKTIEAIITRHVQNETDQLGHVGQVKQPQALKFAIENAAMEIASEIESGEASRDKVSYLLPKKGTVLAINAASAREALQTFLNAFVFKDGAKCVVDRVDPASNGGLAILFHSAPIEKEES